MEKSKAYKLHHQEIREANKDAIFELDEGFKDMVGLLDFKAHSKKVELEPKGIKQTAKKVDVFDDIMAQLRGICQQKFVEDSVERRRCPQDRAYLLEKIIVKGNWSRQKRRRSH